MSDSQELTNAVQRDDAKAIENIVSANPNLLIQLIYHELHLPSLFAVFYDNQESIKTLFKLANDPVLRSRMGSGGSIAVPGGNPVYAYDPTDGVMAHMAVNSAATVGLLKELGVDFNRCTEKMNTMWRQLCCLRDTPGGPGTGDELVDRMDTIDALIETGASIHDIPPQFSLNGSRTGRFMDDLLWDKKHYKDNASVKTSAKKLLFLARRGFDLRAAMEARQEFEHIPPSQRGEWSLMQEMVGPFQEKVTHALSEFRAQPVDSLIRKKAVNTACSGGMLPELLSSLAREGNAGDVREAVSYLDDFWKGEYRHSIARAEATLARVGAVEKSGLGEWVRGN